MKDIVSFDLDDTLYDHRSGMLTPSALKAIELLRKEHTIVLSTGRNMEQESNRWILKETRPDALVQQNGARVKVGEVFLCDYRMDSEQVSAFLCFALDNHYSIGFTHEGVDYYTWPDQVIAFDKVRFGRSDRNFADPWLLTKIPVRSLVLLGGVKVTRVFEKEFPAYKFPLFSKQVAADVVDKRLSKAGGMRTLCAYLGMNMSRVVAFGDSMNDCELIREAGLGIAMGNACEELKAIADYVTDDIGRDGIYKACVQFGLI